ncbi:MAG: hypothetical protein IJD88_07365 [Clostridia bacterium]|nr:hypothetical protein [Clostridia bacterium]
MSGPKVDVAEIRRQEMQRLNAARERHRKEAQLILGTIENLDRLYQNLLDESNGDAAENLESLYKPIKRKLRRIQSTVRNSNALTDTAPLLRETQALDREFRSSLEEQMGVVKEIQANHERVLQDKKRQENIQRIQCRKVDVVEEKNITVEELTQEDIKEQYDRFYEEVSRLASSSEIPKSCKERLLKIHQDLKEVYEGNLPLNKKYKRMQSMFADLERVVEKSYSDLRTMEDIYEEYCSQMFDSNETVRPITDFESVKEIEAEIERVKKCAEEKMSREYVRQQIDEVMSLNGYSVVSSDVLEQTESNSQILYGVDEDTAISVFVSDTNQVTMRVVGIGFDEEISEAEDEALFQRQCAFCRMHPEITKQLAARGVILKTKKHNPPDKKFNKKMNVKNKNGSTTSRAKKELKRKGLKTMKKG